MLLNTEYISGVFLFALTIQLGVFAQDATQPTPNVTPEISQSAPALVQANDKRAISQSLNTSAAAAGTAAELPPPKDIGTGAIHSQIPAPDESASLAPVVRKRPVKENLNAIKTVTYGPAAWALKPKVPAASTAPSATPTESTARTAGVDLEKREAEPTSTLNVRILVPQPGRPVDTLMVYPYPVKPPKLNGMQNRLPDKPEHVKHMLLQSGYSNRIDLSRPYPLYGWRWVHAFTTAMNKCNCGYPNTIFTMYPWVHKVTPFILEETVKSNNQEEERLQNYNRAVEEFETNHIEMETAATTKGLYPIQVKLNSRGIGQVTLPAGHWWLSGARVLPGLRFYWQVPFTASGGQTVNVQLSESSALLIQGGW